MCWSGEASAALATVGVVSTVYAAYKGEPPQLYIPLAYFTLMEILQAFTYSVIDQCGLPSNQVATLLGYLHIVFQPFFINYMAMYFIPKRISSRIAPFIYALCFVAAILMLIRVYPFAWAGICRAGSLLCGPNLCSVHGNWHIAWNIPLNGFLDWPIYASVGIVLPFLYGSWRGGLYNLIVGVGLAWVLTNNPNERPAVWCLLSIGLLLLVIKTPLRKMMRVEKWFLWPEKWKDVYVWPS